MLALRIALGVLAALLLCFLILLFLLAPGVNRRRRAILRGYREKGVNFAHRGLWGQPDGEAKIPAENSLSAFRAASAAGYGFELDTRLSKDRKVVVFHDDRLNRVAGVDRRVDELTAEELSALSLSGTGEGVPLFADVLAAANGAPILVEIKEDGFDHSVTDATAELLKNYPGPFIVESFDPFSLRRFRKLMPDVPTGLLVSHYTKDKKMRKPRYYLLQWMLFNFLCRPDFLAVDGRDADFLPIRLARIFRPVLYAWTVRSPEEEAALRKKGFDGVIFEKYRR